MGSARQTHVYVVISLRVRNSFPATKRGDLLQSKPICWEWVPRDIYTHIRHYSTMGSAWVPHDLQARIRHHKPKRSEWLPNDTRACLMSANAFGMNSERRARTSYKAVCPERIPRDICAHLRHRPLRSERVPHVWMRTHSSSKTTRVWKKFHTTCTYKYVII